MKSVRQRMITPLKLLFIPILGIISSCNPTEITGNGVKSNVIAKDGSMDFMAYIYADNPYMYSGPGVSASNPNMNLYIERPPRVITRKNELKTDCQFSFEKYGYDQNAVATDCIKTFKDATSIKLTSRKPDGTFVFDVHSPEFYQTNTLYHLRIATDTFLNKLGQTYNIVRNDVSSRVAKSIPAYLDSSRMFWFRSLSDKTNKLFQNDYLQSYAQCDLNKNSMFSPVGPTLCFGYISSLPGFYFVQDPTIIYHELGHAFVSIMMNMRNGTASEHHPLRSNLGSYGYDEAGAINEGIADYFSYVMNKRETMGEFGLGTTSKQSRPLSEASSLHIPTLSETPEGRLSYPQFLNYDPNSPDSPSEAVHYAGQITSHYLVALTKSFKDQCSIKNDDDGGHDSATTWMTLLLAETLSELGDLNARGIEDVWGNPFTTDYFFNNLDKDNSYLWAHVVNQVTYRRFYQVFAKNINKYITKNLCPSFSKDESESLLDDYGLLLFRTYNDNGNSTKDRGLTYQSMDANYSSTLTAVSELNRRKSVLVSKNLLELAVKSTELPNRASYYLVDGRTEMDKVLKDFLYKGYTVPLSTNVASTSYNNKNLKISPGEIVAVIPNLLNKSNSTMAGVQLLATDWDHVQITDRLTGNFKPCKVDDVTTVDQGASDLCAPTHTEYKKLLPDPADDGLFPAKASAPVCLVEISENSSTKWVSQNEFRRKQGQILDKDCLGYTKSATTDVDFTMNPHECLVRFLPGGNDAFFSKIEPQKTFQESMYNSQSETNTFNPGNTLLMEINKWIPPGTKFRCRLRARFSNCSDCYNNDNFGKDDFLDYELNGKEPYKIINFDFEVND